MMNFSWKIFHCCIIWRNTLLYTLSFLSVAQHEILVYLQENEVTTMSTHFFSTQAFFFLQLRTGDARLNTELLLVGGKPWILQRRGEI